MQNTIAINTQGKLKKGKKGESFFKPVRKCLKIASFWEIIVQFNLDRFS